MNPSVKSVIKDNIAITSLVLLRVKGRVEIEAKPKLQLDLGSEWELSFKQNKERAR